MWQTQTRTRTCTPWRHPVFVIALSRNLNLFPAKLISPDICFQSKLQFPFFPVQNPAIMELTFWSIPSPLTGSGLMLNLTWHWLLLTNLLSSKPAILLLKGTAPSCSLCFSSSLPWYYCLPIMPSKQQTKVAKKVFWKERFTLISDLKNNFRFLGSWKIVCVLRSEQPGTSVTYSLLMFIKWLVEKHGFNYSGNFYQHYCQPGMSVAGSLVARRTY